MVRIVVRNVSCPVLLIAEQQDVIRNDRIARGQIGEAPFRPDLVALEDPRITLDRFHQRAGLGLFGGAALAEAAAGKTSPEFVDVLGRRREIVLRVKIGVHRQIGFDPLQPCDHAGEGTYVFTESRDRGAGRHGPVPAACHDQLGSGANFDRLWRPARIFQFLVAAGRALRTMRKVMFRDG
jgi:hypothetical protein